VHLDSISLRVAAKVALYSMLGARLQKKEMKMEKFHISLCIFPIIARRRVPVIVHPNEDFSSPIEDNRVMENSCSLSTR
jgi:hypothetical protein